MMVIYSDSDNSRKGDNESVFSQEMLIEHKNSD